jgi:hypothetical protein
VTLLLGIAVLFAGFLVTSSPGRRTLHVVRNDSAAATAITAGADGVTPVSDAAASH